MHEFFRGWRRKTGCVTLVVTCALMSMWVRSLRMSDEVRQSFAGHYVVVGSLDGDLQLTYHNCDEFIRGWRPGLYSWPLEQMGLDPLRRRPILFKYEPAIVGPTRISPLRFCVPYRSFVLPLTFASAYLLLSKARRPDSA